MNCPGHGKPMQEVPSKPGSRAFVCLKCERQWASMGPKK